MVGCPWMVFIFCRNKIVLLFKKIKSMHRYSLFMCYDGWYSCIAAFNNWFIFVFKLGFLRFCTHTCQHGWYPGDIFFDLFYVGAELYSMLSCCWSCFFWLFWASYSFFRRIYHHLSGVWPLENLMMELNSRMVPS